MARPLSHEKITNRFRGIEGHWEQKDADRRKSFVPLTCMALFVPSDLIEIGLEGSFCDAEEEV